MDDLIRKLSEIRSEYNCFDKDEESYYHALSEAIRILSQRADCDTISRQAAIELVTDVCDAIMSGCNSHYDSEVGDEVYDDIREVDAILKCNKEIRKALKGMPSAQAASVERMLKGDDNAKPTEESGD